MCASFRVFSLNFEGDNCPLGRFFKGQFQLQCGIGAMARPGLNPGDNESLVKSAQFFIIIQTQM